MKRQTQVMLVDDHPLILEIMQAVLRKSLAPVAIYAETNLESALKRARQVRRLDLVVLDLLLPGCRGIEALARFLEAFPRVQIVVMSALEEGGVVRSALAAGARGYIPKTSGIDVIQSALRVVAAGGTYVPLEALSNEPHEAQPASVGVSDLGLSNRQLEVLCRIAKGLHNRQIARELQISENTVKHHTHALFKVLGVNTRTEAMLALVRRHFPFEETPSA